MADMPGVGADLQDHLQVRMQFRCTEPVTMNDVVNNWRHRYAAGLRYMLSRKGSVAIDPAPVTLDAFSALAQPAGPRLA